jgi:hypothetical protein
LEISLVFGGKRFVILVFVAYFATVIVSSILLELLVTTAFTSQLAQTLFSGVAFLFLFIVIARHYLSPVPRGFWIKFAVLALAIACVYFALIMIVGEPLIALMNLETTAIPPNSLLTVSEYRLLSLYTYGISSITNGLTSLALVYLIQKYLIRYLFRGFKLLTKYQNFFDSKAPKPKSTIWTYALWLILLPFPIQQALSPSTIGGVNIVNTGLILPSVLALFVSWGLSATSLVGITKNKVFRLYDTINGALLGLLAIQWASFLVYSTAKTLLLQDAIAGMGILLVRSVFIFGPQALIIAYLYKKVLENRTQTTIVEYLKQKENLTQAEIEVQAKQEPQDATSKPQQEEQ